MHSILLPVLCCHSRMQFTYHILHESVFDSNALLVSEQDDAAKRLVSPDASEVRAINVEIEFYSQPAYLFKIDKARFSPEPTVDGALVRFELRQPSEYLLAEGRTPFMKMVRIVKAPVQKAPALLQHDGLGVSSGAQDLQVDVTPGHMPAFSCD